MKTFQAKLASTASGMGFEAWRRRPVYKVQCLTAKMANELCGVALRAGEGRASYFGDPKTEGLDHFRCLPGYRTKAANELRTRVAQQVKLMRREAALMC